MRRYILYIGIVAMFAISCQKDLQEEVSTPVDYGEAVAVNLDFIVDGTEAGTEQVQSKAGNSTEDDLVSSEIKNIWIIQFDGTDDDSEAIAAHYISTLTDVNEVTLLPLGRATTVVAIANTYNPDLIPMPLRMTISEFKARHRTIVTNTLGTGAYWGDGVVSYGSDGYPYFILNDSRDVLVNNDGYVTYADGDNGTIYDPDDEDSEDSSVEDSEDSSVEDSGKYNLSFELKRNVAKVVVTLNNYWSDAEMLYVTMNGVATESYFYTNRNENDPLEALEAPFPSTDVATMRYATHNIVEQTSETIVFYVPVNMQGINTTASDETKPYYAPISSTYLTVILSETNDEYSAIEYRIYLGANLTNDYNLEPNKEYEYTINFTGSGIVEGDYRVNEIGVIDYTTRESANCYIINPSQEVTRVYYLPIEDRINEFWKEYAGESDDKIKATTEWEIVPLWYDHNTGETDIPSSLTLEKVVRDEGHAIKVTVPEDYSYYTNLIIGVSIDDEIVWSWHLWITDYNPDSRDYAVIDGEYSYPVDGGYIERYIDNEANITSTGPIWGSNETQKGIYADMFIMDRNLGARDATRYGQGGNTDNAAGALFYQFGRKDPFPGGSGYLFVNGVSTDTSFNPNSNSTTGIEFTKAGVVDFDYTVNNPTTFITSSTNWCNETESYSNRYLWNDVKCFNPTVDDEGMSILIVENEDRRKSIFDPSPLGWRLPIAYVWNDFDETTFPTNSYVDEFKQNRSYTLTNAMYVANGYRSADDGAYYVGTSHNGYIWSASPNIYMGATQARSLTFNLTEVNYQKDMYRANAFNVRCIKDNLVYEEVE